MSSYFLPSNFKEWFLDFIGPATDIGMAIATKGGSLVWTALNDVVDALLQPKFQEVINSDVITDSMIKRIESDPKVTKARNELTQAVNSYNSLVKAEKDPILGKKDNPLVTILTLGLFSPERTRRKLRAEAEKDIENSSKNYANQQQKVADDATMELRDSMGLIKL